MRRALVGNVKRRNPIAKTGGADGGGRDRAWTATQRAEEERGECVRATHSSSSRITRYAILLHYITVHYIALHRITSHYITLCYSQQLLERGAVARRERLADRPARRDADVAERHHPRIVGAHLAWENGGRVRSVLHLIDARTRGRRGERIRPVCPTGRLSCSSMSRRYSRFRSRPGDAGGRLSSGPGRGSGGGPPLLATSVARIIKFSFFGFLFSDDTMYELYETLLD